MTDQDEPSRRMPEIHAVTPPRNVPVFNVVIYVSKSAAGCRARVANLPDLNFSGPSEPAVLKQAVTEVKQCLGKWLAEGRSIPWIEPLPPREADEQERLIPVHL